jgi:hypothetical protein
MRRMATKTRQIRHLDPGHPGGGGGNASVLAV